ncbi:hypothetical protein M885DRAFT_24871 [Pelagophyceae sp. CCMP2097]|nr:hypothetical protein M885DRAFT_24871 [Pelagophyceae sp. CCMP2097]
MAARPTLTHELHRHRNAAHRYSELEARLDSHRRSTSDLTKFLQGLEGGEGHDGEERDGLARLLARLEGHASSFDATTSQLATERQRRLRVLERVDEVVCEATNPTRGSDVEYAPEVDEPTLEAPRAAGPAAGPRRAQDALLTSQSTPMVGSEPAQAVEARRASLEPESRKPALAQFRKVVRAMTAIRNFSPKTPSQPVPPIKMDGGTTFDVQMLQRTPSRLQRAFLDEARGDEAPQGDGGATRARATSACASREDAGGPFDDLRPRASSSRSRASTSRPSASRPRTFFDEAPTAEEVCGGEAKTEEARPEWPEWPSEALSPESHEDARWLDTESVGSENDAVDANASFYCRRAFNPEALVYWDYFMTALILIYACFYDTYRKTFMYDRGSRVLGNLLDFVFAVDMCISAQTAFTANGYSLVTDRKKVFVHYLTTWFAVDFASTVPWDSVAMWFGRPRTPILQILSLVRVFRVLRAPRIIHRMTLDWTIHTVKLAFVIYAIFTLLVAHLLGCLFWLAPDVFPSRGGSGLSWKEFNGLTRFEEQRQYLNCLYWAITTMTTLGYGDLAPRLEAEMVIAVFAEIIGATAFALLVMHIQKLYDVLIEDDGNNVRQRNDLAVYLDQMHVRRSLKGKVMRYLSYKAHTHSYTSFNDADPRMSGLTPALKLELRLEIFRPILARNAVFSNVPEAALNAMARHIVSRPCSPGEFFIERGAYGTHCAFLLAGKLKIVDGGGQDFKVVRATDANNVVAITSLLDDDVHASLQSLMKQLSAQAVDHCSLAIICRADFRNHVLKVWPDAASASAPLAASPPCPSTRGRRPTARTRPGQ